MSQTLSGRRPACMSRKSFCVPTLSVAHDLLAWRPSTRFCGLGGGLGALALFCAMFAAAGAAAVPEEVATDATPASSDEAPAARLFVVEPHLSGLNAALSSSVLAAVGQAAQEEGLTVLTRDDVTDILTHAADLALLGSDADGPSLAMLGEKVGADYLLTSTVSQVDDDTVIHTRLVKVATSAVLVRREVRASQQGGLMPALRAAAQLALAPVFAHLKGTLTVRVSEEGANVLVDDDLVGTSPVAALTLPGGVHTVAVTKEGFIREARTFRMTKGAALVEEFTLRPSVEFLEAYRAKNGLYRTLAWTTTGLALPLVAGALGGALGWMHFNGESERLAADVAARQLPEYVPNPQGGTPLKNPELVAAEEQRTALGTQAVWSSAIGGVAGVGGLVSGVLAGYFWIFGDDPQRYDAWLPAADAE